MTIELDMTEAKFFTTLIFHNNSQQVSNSYKRCCLYRESSRMSLLYTH